MWGCKCIEVNLAQNAFPELSVTSWNYPIVFKVIQKKNIQNQFLLLVCPPTFPPSPPFPYSLTICALGGEMNVQQNQPIWLASEVFNIYFLLYFTQEQAWSHLPANNDVLHSHCGDSTPTSSFKGNLQRDIVFAYSHCDRCFISSTSTCELICKGLPTLCSQLWKLLQCHLWQHSFHSPDLTGDHIQEQGKQTTLITSLQTFPGQIVSDKHSLGSM